MYAGLVSGAVRRIIGATSDGAPLLIVELDADLDYGLGPLALRHELVFDGIGYHSRVFLASVESSARVQHDGRVIWRKLNGQPFTMRLRQPSVCGDGEYFADVGSDGAVIITRTDRCESYRYEASLLTSMRRRDVQLDFEYSNGSLIRISDDSGKSMYSRRTISEHISSISVGAFHCTIMEGPLRRIEEVHTTRGTLKFIYEEGLVMQAFLDDRKFAMYRWAAPEMDQWWIAIPPPPPVVVQDLRNTYRVRWRDGHAIVELTRPRR